MEEDALTGDRVERHQHPSQNVEETDTNTSSNQQHNIVDIESYFASDYEGSYVGGASLEGAYDKDDDDETTLWFRKIIPLLILFRKVSLSFIAVFITYVYIDEMMIIFSVRSLQTHKINIKPLK